MNQDFGKLKTASELRVQAYALLEKAACLEGACGCAPAAVGDAVPSQIVAPAAPGVVVTTQGEPIAPAAVEESPVLVLSLSEKTAALSHLERVASELDKSDDENLKALASKITVIAAEIDKTARVVEDGFSDGGVVKDRLVDEMEGSFKGGVLENGGQGGQGQAAINSFNTDKSSEVQNLPFLKKK
jgi:hypothetical protein